MIFGTRVLIILNQSVDFEAQSHNSDNVCSLVNVRSFTMEMEHALSKYTRILQTEESVT